ncbi:hypothetical protein [Brevundimonas sp.]|uniref:hypothetical protein n=1 Tax=Brevundimonas sp. TaxID=1871086 RepID=UPI002ED8E5A8
MSPRFTRLEREVMAAMAHDLRHVAPDLAGQFEESLPGTRRNTGSGLFSEVIVSSRRPLSDERATGRFGTVHAMVGGLPDPIAFQVELRNGRLLALPGDAYGQDTRAIDFTQTPFEQVFTLNDQGESIAFDPAALMKPSPLLALHQHQDREPVEGSPGTRPLVNRGPLERLQEDPASDLDAMLREPLDPHSTPQLKSLLTGIWLAVAVAGLLAVILFRVSFIFVVVAAIWLGAILRKPAARTALTHAAKALSTKKARAFPS